MITYLSVPGYLKDKEIENEEREKTGVKSLKIGFNKVFIKFLSDREGKTWPGSKVYQATQKFVYINVHSNIIYRSQKVETIKMLSTDK